MASLNSSSKSLSTSSLVRNVAVVGGTHGNELTGIFLVKHFTKKPIEIKRESNINIKYYISNIAAVKVNQRYVDTDLNRCFSLKNLQGENSQKSVEEKRAEEINTELGPKNSQNPKTDLILDLHSTTSNTGILLCFHENDAFALELAAYLYSKNNNIRAVLWPSGDQPYLPTIARSGMTMEFGPVAHSTVSAPIFFECKKIVEQAIQYIQKRNEVTKVPGAFEKKASGKYCRNRNVILRAEEILLPLGQRIGQVSYPRNAKGEVTAIVHPDLQGIKELRGGSVLVDGEPIFLTLEGDTLIFDRRDYDLEESDLATGVYPLFVNEAAYYEKDVAFFMNKLEMQKVRILADSPASSML